MKRTLKVVMLIAVLAVVLLSMTACGKTKIDVAEGMTVVFSGADGKGYAEISYPDSDDTPPYIDKLLGEKKFDANEWSAWMMLAQAISCEVEPSSGLSNGDKVTVTIDVDEAILENMDVSAKDQQLTFTVKGLTEVIVIDAFEDFEINFTGISPAAKAEFAQNKEVDGVTVSYKCDGNGYYKVGDVVTVTARINNSDYYALKETTKEFTVANIDKYITSSSELLPDTFERMKAEGDAILADKIADWGYFTYYGYEYVGYEFWGRQESNASANVNYIYLYYKIRANDGVSDFDTYYFVRFSDVLQHADGKQEVDLTRYHYPVLFFYETLKEYTTLESRVEEEAQHNYDFTIEKFF